MTPLYIALARHLLESSVGLSRDVEARIRATSLCLPSRPRHGNSRRQSEHQPHRVGINDVEVRISADTQWTHCHVAGEFILGKAQLQ